MGSMKYSHMTGTATVPFTSDGVLVISFISEFAFSFPPYIRTHTAPLPSKTDFIYTPQI